MANIEGDTEFVDAQFRLGEEGMPQVKLLVWIWPAHKAWLILREKKEIGPWRWRLVDKKNKEGRGSRLEDLCHCFSNVMSLLVIHNYRPMSGMGAIQRSAGSEWGAKWRPVGGQTPGGWVSHDIATFWYWSDSEKCTQLLHSQEAENQAAAVEARQGEVQVISSRLVSRELKILSFRVSKAPPIQSVQEQAGGKTRM